MAFMLIAEDNETSADSLSFCEEFNLLYYSGCRFGGRGYDTLKKNKIWMNRIVGDPPG